MTYSEMTCSFIFPLQDIKTLLSRAKNDFKVLQFQLQSDLAQLGTFYMMVHFKLAIALCYSSAIHLPLVLCVSMLFDHLMLCKRENEARKHFFPKLRFPQNEKEALGTYPFPQ